MESPHPHPLLFPSESTTMSLPSVQQLTESRDDRRNTTATDAQATVSFHPSNIINDDFPFDAIDHDYNNNNNSINNNDVHQDNTQNNNNSSNNYNHGDNTPTTKKKSMLWQARLPPLRTRVLTGSYSRSYRSRKKTQNASASSASSSSPTLQAVMVPSAANPDLSAIIRQEEEDTAVNGTSLFSPLSTTTSLSSQPHSSSDTTTTTTKIISIISNPTGVTSLFHHDGMILNNHHQDHQQQQQQQQHDHDDDDDHHHFANEEFFEMDNAPEKAYRRSTLLFLFLIGTGLWAPPVKTWRQSWIWLLKWSIRGMVLATAISDEIMKMTLFDHRDYEYTANGVALFNIIFAYVFTILILRKPRPLPELIQLRTDKQLTRLVRILMAIGAILLAVLTLPRIYTNIDFLNVHIHSMSLKSSSSYSSSSFSSSYAGDPWRGILGFSAAFLVSNMTYYIIWIASLLIHTLATLLHVAQVSDYIAVLKRNGFPSIKQAKIAHLQLVTHIERTNAAFSKFLVISVFVYIFSLIVNLYIYLQPVSNNGNNSGGSGGSGGGGGGVTNSSLLTPGGNAVWFANFWYYCMMLVLLLLPCSAVTRRCRHLMKHANKRRAISEDTKQNDSFLLYLQTSHSGYRVAGVLITLGFITKSCVTMFSICAFVIKHQLTINKQLVQQQQQQ